MADDNAPSEARDDNTAPPTEIIRPLIDALQAQMPTARRNTLRDLLARGVVRVNGRTVKVARHPVGPADRVEIVRSDAPTPGLPALPLPVVFEDPHMIVVDKPAGLLTSTVPTERRPTALALVRAYIAARNPSARVGLVHRLDRDASGLLVFSLHNAALGGLKRQFAARSAGRVYAAVVSRPMHPPQGTLRSWLVEYADGTVHATKDRSRGDEAITHYTTISQCQAANGEHRSLLRIALETGRKHQIRAHLAEADRPILGDRVYGGDDAPRLMLAAIELKLVHPINEDPRHFTIKLPEPLAACMRGS